MPAVSVTIYHNPRCSKSRATLELLRRRGIEPRIIAYVERPPDRGSCVTSWQCSARGRASCCAPPKKAAGLDDPALGDHQLIAGMIAHPIVIERPIVVAGDQARLGRPPERVLEIL